MNALVQVPSYEQSPLAAATQRLYQAFVGVRQAQPNLGLRGWSRLLSCSEGELQASRLGHEKVRPLVDTFSLLYQLAGLGEVEIISFNQTGWARYTGRFAPPDLCLDNPSCLGLEFRSSHLRLQLRMNHWYWGCVVEDQPPGQTTQSSLQFFNQSGQRFLKIQATAATSQPGWQRVVDNFARHEASAQPLFVEEQENRSDSTPQDIAGFTQEWRLMQSPNQIDSLLKRHQADYLTALQHLGTKFAREVSLDSLQDLLRQVQWLPKGPNKPCLEASFFTSGCTQTVSGAIQPPRLQHKDWCLGYAEGCLHLQAQRLEEAWVVRKPCEEGWVTSLELFDVAGQCVLAIQESKLSLVPENLLLREIFASLV